MKNLSVTLAISALLVSACASSPKGAEPAAASAPQPPQKSEEQLRAESQLLIDQARALAGLPPMPENGDVAEPREEWVVVDDAVTGRKLQRIPKNETLSVVDGKLRHALLNPKMFSLPLVREDERFYYVEPPTARPKKPGQGEEPMPEGLKPVRDVPPSEYDVVTPAASGTRLRFEEKSAGLPTGGYWRTNMTLADLDGDGGLEIVTPAPRLSSSAFRVFRYKADGSWEDVALALDAAPDVAQSYGGVATGDFDADGRLDVVTVGHGAGPAIAFNRGGFRFDLRTQGLPGQVSSRAVGVADIDRDGRLDLLTVSDEPEAVRAADEKMKAARDGRRPAPEPEAGAYRRGFDVRAFFGRADGTFEQSTAGLETACFAYSLALAAPPATRGNPYFATGCRYRAGRAILFEYDAEARSFRGFGRDVAEPNSVHQGAATGTWAGKDAAFVSYIKGNAPGAPEDKPTRGYGLSVLYRDGAAWKSRRIVKTLTDDVDESLAIGVGDLNGDGLDDLAWGDDAVGRVRVFFQKPDGAFEELDPALQPKYPNYSMSMKIADVDRDGRNDIVLMFEFRSSSKSRAGGLKFFRNLG